MTSSPVDEAYNDSQAQSNNHSKDCNKPEEHMDHNYSVCGDLTECDIPYSALSPDTMELRRKIRRLHRRAQRQKHKIKCMKQLIKTLRVTT
ncbi:hypothetical protein GDO81_013097 [Engystomops pustulosus]|uniref:Uncharacterized protein n=1 Tax=Engystomops pustulosus TaxID=76066 RepID=A0AAV7B3G5_ENGPU|nr:hypothetical protein GDO81_013097 [Engystomops pustulosus]